mmetsp:Transcript_18118/g.26629  ORF Transcript_18118/g.26629 Transcript_18118/m.26629 type:complete len:214 (+) Transcript_18118:985-1626(+)
MSTLHVYADVISLIASHAHSHSHACLFGGGTELTCEVFDATGGTEQMTGFRGGHECRHGGYDDSDIRSSGGFELADDPGSEGLEGFDGTGVGCGASTVSGGTNINIGTSGSSCSSSCSCSTATTSTAGGGHGGTGRDEDEGEAECSTRLGKDIPTSALVEDTNQGLPLIHKYAILADIEDCSNCDTGSGHEGGDDAVEFSDGIVRYHSEGIRG